MTEYHRALVVLLLVGLAVYRLADPLRTEQLPGAHGRRRALWFVLTFAAFAFGNFWYFSAVALAVVLYARRREENAAALFLAILFVVPPLEHEIPGLGLVNFLFGLSLPRLLVLTLLLPLFVQQLARPRARSTGWARTADFLFVAWLGIQLLLLAREPSLSSAMRSSFYLFVDLVVPYYVFSRGFADARKLQDAVGALVVAGLVLAAVGLVEASRHWLLYSALAQAWGSTEPLLYLSRSGMLRAMGSTGHAIALGLVLATCLLLYLPMHSRMRPGWRRTALLLLLAGGLFVPLSRGPWVGAAAGLLLYVALGPRPGRNLLVLGAGGLAALALLAVLPFGHVVLDLVPFFGTVEAGNVEYRQRLMENASILVWRHPLLGSPDYEQRLAEMGMVQGQGIVDVVNTYVQVALRSGLAGLALFGGVLAAALLAALRGRRLALRSGEPMAADLGRSLAAAQVAVIVTIGSVSSIVVIPWLYWCLAGMLVGYGRVVHAAAREARAAAGPLRFA